jgi:mercuric ion transport protein
MKVVIGSVVAALGASACCLGPVVFSIIGAGALGAASTRLEPLRPVFLGLTAVLLAAAFHATYAGQGSEACGPGETCRPTTKKLGKLVLWIATIVIVLLVTFPYYVGWVL